MSNINSDLTIIKRRIDYLSDMRVFPNDVGENVDNEFNRVITELLLDDSIPISRFCRVCLNIIDKKIDKNEFKLYYEQTNPINGDTEIFEASASDIDDIENIKIEIARYRIYLNKMLEIRKEVSLKKGIIIDKKIVLNLTADNAGLFMRLMWDCGVIKNEIDKQVVAEAFSRMFVTPKVKKTDKDLSLANLINSFSAPPVDTVVKDYLNKMRRQWFRLQKDKKEKVNNKIKKFKVPGTPRLKGTQPRSTTI